MTSLTGRGAAATVYGNVQRSLIVAVALALSGTPALAHDLRIPLDDLRKGVQDIGALLARLQRVPVVPGVPQTREDHQRILGAAEIDVALGHDDEALEKLLGRISDPNFRALPEYVPTLLLTAQVLEKQNEPVGAMMFSKMALDTGGSAEAMAEAGSRWFRLARRNEVLSKRGDMLALWQSRGGAKAATPEVAAAAAYESAFALRELGRREEAQKLLASVPSDGPYGSRAAYLAGAMFVESGDLESGIKWFTAVMDWPIPVGLADEAQQPIEREVRELAAMSAARLMYEKGQYDQADAAYGRIGDGSRHLRDACFERAYLAIERKRRVGALRYLGCVTDLGAKGERWVDVRLAKASMLAHLSKYSESVEAYEVLHASLVRERALLVEALGSISKPSDFLFTAMERGTLADGREASPGPATLFGDSWSADVDRAYRLDRDVRAAKGELGRLAGEVRRYQDLLRAATTFPAFENRRRVFHQIMRDVQHLSAHAGDIAVSSDHGRLVADGNGQLHAEDRAEVGRLLAQLDQHARAVEAELRGLSAEEERRRQQAEVALSKIAAEAEVLAAEALLLAGEVGGVSDSVAQASLDALRSRYDKAVMRSEAGVLDTYWVRKEHVSEQIRAIGVAQEQMKSSFDGAIDEVSKDPAAE